MMNILHRLRAAGLALGLCAAIFSAPASAQQASSPLIPTEAGWELTVAPYVLHFSNDSEHKYAWLVGI